jgi:hypothetical protein
MKEHRLLTHGTVLQNFNGNQEVGLTGTVKINKKTGHTDNDYCLNGSNCSVLVAEKYNVTVKTNKLNRLGIKTKKGNRTLQGIHIDSIPIIECYYLGMLLKNKKIKIIGKPYSDKHATDNKKPIIINNKVLNSDCEIKTNNKIETKNEMICMFISKDALELGLSLPKLRKIKNIPNNITLIQTNIRLWSTKKFNIYDINVRSRLHEKYKKIVKTVYSHKKNKKISNEIIDGLSVNYGKT